VGVLIRDDILYRYTVEVIDSDIPCLGYVELSPLCVAHGTVGYIS